MTVDLSIIVPLFNEEDSISPLYAAIVCSIEPLALPFEIVFVDDGSTDRTLARLEDLVAGDPRVVTLKFRRNAGQTAAMTAGIDYARGRVLFTMDGDLQNDPADIPMMLAKLDEGYDLVVGWRVNRQDRLFSRKLPSRVANWLIGRITGLPIRDNGCSLKAYRADLVKRVPLYSEMHRFIPAMTIPLGARIAEVPVRHHARRFGQSKYGLSRIYKVLLDLIAIKMLLLFSRRPLARFAGAGVACMAAAAAFVGAALTVMAAPSGSAVTYATVAAMLASLSVFLILLGGIAAVVHQGWEARRVDVHDPASSHWNPDV